MPGVRYCRKGHESHFFGERHHLFGAPLRRSVVPSDQVVYGRLAGMSQHVRIGRPLSHLQYLARFSPGTIGITEFVQAKVEVGERVYPTYLQLLGKGLAEVENGQRLLQVLIPRAQLAEVKKDKAARSYRSGASQGLSRPRLR
jgi:hypothetical protein